MEKLRRLPPLHSACENGNLGIVKILVQKINNINKGGGVFHMTPIHWACDNGHLDVAVYLTEEAACELGECTTRTDTPDITLIRGWFKLYSSKPII